jgi:hypothetical protein
VTTLDPTLAATLARVALAHVEREYPSKLDHVLHGPDDVRGPRELHPVFYGSFDWHSCVHGYWLLATLLRRDPRSAESRETRALFDRQLTPEKLAVETAYLSAPGRAGFERPYGWAWVLMLSAELARHDTDEGRRWEAAVRQLASAVVARYTEYLAKLTYPIRTGTHFNTAFAIALALEYAAERGDKRFARLLRARAAGWFGADRDCQAWEPGGDDFLSGALMEAECMRRALSPNELASWMGGFFPRLAAREPATLFVPATVSDRSDGKIAHLDGLNLSRAWCWGSLASTWDASDPRRALALETARAHLAAGLPHVSGDYMGEHWLATFALLALMAQPSPE